MQGSKILLTPLQVVVKLFKERTQGKLAALQDTVAGGQLLPSPPCRHCAAQMPLPPPCCTQWGTHGGISSHRRMNGMQNRHASSFAIAAHVHLAVAATRPNLLPPLQIA